MSIHKREDDPTESDYRHERKDETNVPDMVRSVVFVIEKLGIQGAIIGALLYICFISLNQMKSEATSNTALVVAALDKNSAALRDLRHFLTKKYDD